MIIIDIIIWEKNKLIIKKKREKRSVEDNKKVKIKKGEV